MQPIISLPDAKVEYVVMSPCEKYVLTYAPNNKYAFVVWDFQMVSIIREFEQQMGETQFSFQWSHDGKYIAKKSEVDIKKKNE